MRPKIQVYAVLRVDTDTGLPPGSSGPGVDIERLGGTTIRGITVQAVLVSQADAESEVERLNTLNVDRGATYFWMATRYYPEGRQGD
jgi:hypothetical protein